MSEEKKNLTEEERKELKENLKKQIDEMTDDELEKVAGGASGLGSLKYCWEYLKKSGHAIKAKEIAETEGEPAARKYIHFVIVENLGVYPPSTAVLSSWCQLL
ncbi:hypothetical protein SAMN02910289_00841 [Lachnospiraceae bacterium RM5]|nr:hypothetical protein SAMN02910289_00841 [Lachnospiraceae bacterium RM5]